MVCYDINGNVLWISNKDYGTALTTFRQGGTIAITDFNRDGILKFTFIMKFLMHRQALNYVQVEILV
ncbi:MAG: hypothetical protein IPJ39_20375 [Saprospiraceae bacterium]|nr:hypothetical protein [Saprospiraceae bacterium]